MNREHHHHFQPRRAPLSKASPSISQCEKIQGVGSASWEHTARRGRGTYTLEVLWDLALCDSLSKLHK
jgi:hypothetical protein